MVRQDDDATTAAAGDEWRDIATVGDHMEAELIRAFLEGEGIPCMLVGATLASPYTVNVGPLAEVLVKVPASKFDLAHALLEARADDQAWSGEDDRLGFRPTEGLDD